MATKKDCILFMNTAFFFWIIISRNVDGLYRLNGVYHAVDVHCRFGDSISFSCTSVSMI